MEEWEALPLSYKSSVVIQQVNICLFRDVKGVNSSRKRGLCKRGWLLTNIIVVDAL